METLLRRRAVFWVVTTLMVLMIGSGAIFDLVKSDEDVELFVDDLGYPDYFPRFLGAAKLLGVATVVAAVVTRRFRRLAGWAYAGLTFDVIGALYPHLSSSTDGSNYVLVGVALLLVLGSYALFSFHHPLTQPLEGEA